MACVLLLECAFEEMSSRSCGFLDRLKRWKTGPRDVPPLTSWLGGLMISSPFCWAATAKYRHTFAPAVNEHDAGSPSRPVPPAPCHSFLDRTNSCSPHSSAKRAVSLVTYTSTQTDFAVRPATSHRQVFKQNSAMWRRHSRHCPSGADGYGVELFRFFCTRASTCQLNSTLRE